MKTAGQFFLKRDRVPLGVALGIVAPLLVFLIIYQFRFSGFSFDEYVNTFFRENKLITFVGVWILVANIAIMTYYINTNKDRTAKGLFFVTLVWGVGVLLLKLFN